MYEARPSHFRRERRAPKFIPLGRAFKSYHKRYRSPGAGAGDAGQRKRERKILAANQAVERRQRTIAAQNRASDRRPNR